jgi:hypothetical protein
MYEAFTIGVSRIAGVPEWLGLLDGLSKSLAREGSPDGGLLMDAKSALEEAEVLGPGGKTDLQGGMFEATAVGEEAVAALDGAEPKRDPLLAEEDVADPKRLLGSGVWKSEPEPKAPTGDAVLCGAEALGSTLEGAAEEEEAVVALDGTGPERDASLVEEAVAALEGAEPEVDPLAKAANGLLEALENALVGTVGAGSVGIAEPKVDPPSEGTDTVLRGDGRRGVELLSEAPPEASPEGTALLEAAGAASSANGDGPEAAKSAKGDLSDGIALREPLELGTVLGDDLPGGAAAS